MNFEVGTHRYKKSFVCLECARAFYNQLGVEKKYLKDVDCNLILLNTYGWKDDTKTEELE